jgi:hypothetical protein
VRLTDLDKQHRAVSALFDGNRDPDVQMICFDAGNMLNASYHPYRKRRSRDDSGASYLKVLWIIRRIQPEKRRFLWYGQ